MSLLQSNPKSPLKILTDEPKWSSAALSVTLTHMGKIFRPEYTHQLIEGECWRGHRPLESVLESASKCLKSQTESEMVGESASSTFGPILHKSHKDHGTAESELDICVKISPSCETCSVEILRTQLNSTLNTKTEPAAKRPKIVASEDSEMAMCSKNASMTDSEIIDALSKALPPIVPHGDEKIADIFLAEPIGEAFDEFSISGEESEVSNNFVITIGDGRQANVYRYHSSIQKLALFYIENADTVDVGKDDDGGFWKVLYVFQKHKVSGNADEGDENGTAPDEFRYSLVGYFTLFHFIALFHKPEPGLILRVCQALILPPFQGQGHGGRLLKAVYKLARQEPTANDGDQKVIQINVEDPAPSFTALRNKIDFELVLENHRRWDWPQIGSMYESYDEKKNILASPDQRRKYFTAMSEKEASTISHQAKITSKQIHITNELMKLREMNRFLHEENLSNEDKESIERLFRLMVKKRLNKEYQDLLLDQPSKNDQKALLARLFDKELTGYERIVSKLSST